MLAVLGPVVVEGPSGRVRVPGRKTREVLALLALAAPRPLTAATLAGRLWDEPPPSAIKTVQAHVSRARTALATAGGRLDGGPAGYRIVAGPAELDVLAVDDLRRRARIAGLAGHDHDAAGWLAEARRRWRGEPELPATHAGEAERARLAEEHLLLVEDHLAAEIAAGRPAAVLAELQALTAAHPLRERLWGLAMTALYRCGRQADAVGAYQAARTHLRDEVGMEPGPELRALAEGVLRHTLQAAAPPGPVARAAVPFDGPHYADADGRHVAWGAYGTGPGDVLLLNPTFLPVDAYQEEAHLADAIRRLSTGRRGAGVRPQRARPLRPGHAGRAAERGAVGARRRVRPRRGRRGPCPRAGQRRYRDGRAAAGRRAPGPGRDRIRREPARPACRRRRVPARRARVRRGHVARDPHARCPAAGGRAQLDRARRRRRRPVRAWWTRRAGGAAIRGSVLLFDASVAYCYRALVTEPHHGTLAELALDLGHGGLERGVLLLGLLVGGLQGRLALLLVFHVHRTFLRPLGGLVVNLARRTANRVQPRGRTPRPPAAGGSDRGSTERS